jgi:NhaC family Na+:H+ antiporter
VQCYAAVFFALIYGFTGFGIAKLKPEAQQQEMPNETA